MAIERIVDTGLHDEDSEEKQVEVSLRPTTFGEYVGQDRLKKNLGLAIDATKKRGSSLDHIFALWAARIGQDYYGECDCARNWCKFADNFWSGD